ncbi:MAG: hypothetical protein AAGJ32_06415 [Pseudomonadota bacterium]
MAFDSIGVFTRVGEDARVQVVANPNAPQAPAGGTSTRIAARLAIVLAMGLTAAGTLLAVGPQRISETAAALGPELTRLFLAMAAIKGLAVIGLAWAVMWRLGEPASIRGTTAYLVSCTAMAAGLAGMITLNGMAVSAIVLHAGLVGTLVLLWRDQAIAARLQRALSFGREHR